MQRASWIFINEYVSKSRMVRGRTRQMQNDPIYQGIFDLVSKSNPHMFRIGPNSKPWLSANKNGIRQRILSVPVPKAKTAH